MIMRLFIGLLLFSLSNFSFAQDQIDIAYYQKKLVEIESETQTLESIQKDYEQIIDSLYKTTKVDSSNVEVYKLMLDYYVLRTSNLRNEMKQMVVIIDKLVSAKKED